MKHQDFQISAQQAHLLATGSVNGGSIVRGKAECQRLDRIAKRGLVKRLTVAEFGTAPFVTTAKGKEALEHWQGTADGD